MTAPADLRCPDCGGALEVLADCVIEVPSIPAMPLRGTPIGRRRRQGAAALCTRCEFGIELVVTGRLADAC